jgi:hypothetical protein
MTTDHREIEDLVLGFEELEDAERARALEHLATCADCRALREGLLRRERDARVIGALPGVGEQRAPLAPEDRAQADASLAALLERAPAERPAAPAPAPARAATPAPPAGPAPATPARVVPLPSPARRVNPWRHATWLVPAAAAAVVAVVVLTRTAAPPLPPEPDSPAIGAPTVVTRPLVPTPGAGPTSVRLERYSGVRGADGGWHTGDAFELRFELPAAAYVLVWHVGPAGETALLYPPTGTARVPRFGAGEVTLPPVSSPERWVFEGEPGAETFVVATREAGEVPLATLGAAVDSALAGIHDRTARLLLLETVLRERFGETGRVDAEHQP